MNEIHQLIEDACSKSGVRYTSGRRVIVDILVRNARPTSAGQLIDTQKVPQSSVYRNLAVLEEAGVVVAIPGADDVVHFELAENYGLHHHHFVCDRCGRLLDVSVPAELESALESAHKAVGRASGVEITDHRVDFSGLVGAVTQSVNTTAPDLAPASLCTR